jgi:hypothetical protein
MRDSGNGKGSGLAHRRRNVTPKGILKSSHTGNA